jgi:serine/threonine-protein kinase HipA
MASVRKVDVATIRLWEHDVGALAWNDARGVSEFEYEPSFLRLNLDIAPLTMQLRAGVFSFPMLNRDTFHGLPGLLADALPDRFGNRIIEAWLARQGRTANDFTPVERLCYMGIRGMGALEFKPATGPQAKEAISIEIAELTRFVADILRHRTNWVVDLKGNRAEALNTIIRVGTSAGGNRAKAVIAWNPKTHEVRSGQVSAPPDFEPWILKFDGVADKSTGDPTGFGRVEYAYHKMALAAGITMSPCYLMEEDGRAHFMTRRFDRDDNGDKIHMQSLCAIAHYDFNAAGEYGYEQALTIIQRLNLGYPALLEMFRRMLFNVVARNQDDHTRNIAFLMDRQGRWSLAPAFDVVWSYNSQGRWTNRHQMTVNGKRDGFVRADLLAVGKQFGIKGVSGVLQEVADAVARWPTLARECSVNTTLLRKIGATHRTKLVKE